MKIIKRIKLPNDMNLSIVELNRAITQKKSVKRFVIGLEIEGKLYFSEDKQYKGSLEDCTWDVLNHLLLYNQGIDLRKFYPEPYLFQKPFNFSEVKKELKTKFQTWLSKDTVF